MKVPRDIHGRDFANHLIRRWGFTEERQTGSYIILVSDIPAFHVSMPAHRPLKTGIFSDLVRYVAERKNITVQDLLRKL